MLRFACDFQLVFLFIMTSYLLGSIPFGLILIKLAGLGDIRKLGSGNIGATNVLRNSNKLLAVATVLLDGGKGVVAIFLVRIFCQDYLVDICVGAAAIVGHIFPVWLRFKGGKGVATSLAVFLVLNWQVGLFACVIWLITYIAIRISGVSALVTFIATPIATYFLTYDIRLIVAVSFICMLVVVRHYENVKRLIKGKHH
jgi:acyl phosphate:glycerol-3-phosphate acyltransferase